jgi:hypothetical protein
VFALGRNELGPDPIVVEGLLTIQNYKVNVLIDPSSTYSSINQDCACHLRWERLELPYTLLLSTSLGKLAKVRKYIPRCVIKVGKEDLLGD